MNDESRDPELEAMLSPARHVAASKKQVQQWQHLAESTARSMRQTQKRHWQRRWLEWAAAASIGIMVGSGIGLWLAQSQEKSWEPTASLHMGATEERVFANRE